MAASSGYKCSFEKLNGNNYAVWSYKMELMLLDQDLWDAIDGDKPAATETIALARWNKSDGKARVRIGL